MPELVHNIQFIISGPEC